MDKKQMNNTKKYIKKVLKRQSISITDEQLQYLLEEYKEEGYVIGIHKTNAVYEKIFKEGLYNETDLNRNNADLTNTVTPINNLAVIGAYTELGEDRKTAIIIKMPYKAFSGEEPLYKINEHGKLVIPSNFILGALKNGEIYHNEKYVGKCEDATIYNENYYSAEVKESYNKSLKEKQEECSIFEKAKYEIEHPIKSTIEKVISLFKRKNKVLQLSEPTKEVTKRIICERVEEPDLGDRTKYLEQNEEQNIQSKEEEL